MLWACIIIIIDLYSHTIIQITDGRGLEETDGGGVEETDGGRVEESDGGGVEETDGGGVEETDGGGVEETDGGESIIIYDKHMFNGNFALDDRGTLFSSPYFTQTFAGLSSIQSSTLKALAARPTTASGSNVATSSVVDRAKGGGGSTVHNGGEGATGNGGEGIEESGVYEKRPTTTTVGLMNDCVTVRSFSLCYYALCHCK